ncbi:hypothetical protein BDZ91DRAFT_740370 [Kalaharituber pfeilii]|nr:hypothetical protein BDZ91DRAFT_740370 [Kalaharituber pfeilii]
MPPHGFSNDVAGAMFCMMVTFKLHWNRSLSAMSTPGTAKAGWNLYLLQSSH